ncbi:MAG: EAL domain-containing protein [Acidobacteriota bacterium]|nr:EAL domain-containing protein [Acidobacteriota bacterium]
MNKIAQNKTYMLIILAIGFVCLSSAVINLPIEKFDKKFFILFCFTIGLGSRVTLQIPRFKSYIAVSDTFIFLALLLYGGEFAVVLSAIEAFSSSWRFCNKKITVFFNAAVMTLSTSMVVFTLKISGLYTESQLHGRDENLNKFIIALSVIALTQFAFNTTLASIYGALKSEKPLLETWKTKYVWTFITYIVGAISAGILLQLTDRIGFAVIVATFPIIYFVYLTYRMYMKNVEMSLAQAEQAESHASILEEQSRALAESEERFRSAFNHAPIGIALVSPDGNWLKINNALMEIFEYSEEEFLATDFQSMLHEEDLGVALVKIHELLSGKVPACQAEQRYMSKSGKPVWVSWSVSTAVDAESARPNLIFQIQDITQKKLAEHQLQYKASHDALTGLPNRALFMSRLEQALSKIQDNPQYKVSVLFIDLDRFKIVNDSLGHQIGDDLLIGISSRLHECLRPSDLVARMGGDEFTILVEGRYDTNEVIRIAERINEKFALPFNLSGHEVYSSASIGILHASENHLTPADMMRDADTAMYQAKRAGKARHEVFDRNMYVAAKEMLQLETDLRHAVEKQEFSVFYQPIYTINDCKLEGFEALARWNHQTLGTVSPDKFIPLAEEIGLINMLGEQILRRACEQGCQLQSCLPEGAPFSVSVNLSVKQFANAALVKDIEKILRETSFSAHNLKLEITESVFLEHKERAVEMLHELRALGVEINIDDFGTGYSNLNYLTRLPITTLKIDRSFIAPIEGDGKSVEIVQTIVMLAHNLGMRVTAEGVENEIQLEQLKKLNCEAAQGYYFAKPMNFEDAMAYLGDKSENLKLSNSQSFDGISLLRTVQ